MYSLYETECRATSVSTNSENQGNSGETKLGLSIYVEYRTSNEALDRFDPKLRSSFYEGAANDAQQDFTGHLPNPKFKLAKPICWPYVGAGYSAIIHPQFDVNDELEIDDVKVDKFQFTIEDDGVVLIKHRIYLHPTLEQVGPLCALEKHEIKLTLVPPKVSEAVHQEEEPDAIDDLFDRQDHPPEKTQSALYARAVAAVRATGNPTASALQTELKIGFNDAALYLARMEEEGVIEQKGDEYVVVDQDAAA